MLDDEQTDDFDLLENLRKRVEALENGKADRIVYNPDENTVQLYSGDTALDEPEELYDFAVMPDDTDSEYTE